MDVVHPYSTMEYGSSLNHVGEAIYVPEWGTTVLRRECGGGYYDAIGTYPITVLAPDCDLKGGLDRLADLGLVSVVTVMENLLRPALADLERVFDFARPFKQHFVYDRTETSFRFSRNHRDKIRRAARVVHVERFVLADRLDEWCNLYQSVIARHGLGDTMHAFPRSHHALLARLQRIVAIGAFAGDRLVSCHIWACHNGHAMSHLVASNDEGYASRAAYAVNALSSEILEQCTVLNFGGAAGAGILGESGLVQFKRGFANATASAYLCGKVLAAEIYEELSRRSGALGDVPYFPAYRQSLSAMSSSSSSVL